MYPWLPLFLVAFTFLMIVLMNDLQSPKTAASLCGYYNTAVTLQINVELKLPRAYSCATVCPRGASGTSFFFVFFDHRRWFSELRATGKQDANSEPKISDSCPQ